MRGNEWKDRELKPSHMSPCKVRNPSSSLGIKYFINILIQFQVNLGTMENEKYIPSFGKGEELEFDVHEHEGKRMAINVTGPGGAPLKGFKFIFEKAQN